MKICTAILAVAGLVLALDVVPLTHMTIVSLVKAITA